MTVNWLESDMRHIPYESEFDGIFNVFVSFGLLETDAEDQRVLEQVRKALKPGGRFLLETLHRDGWLRGRRRHSVDRHADNSIVLIERDFDPVYGRNITRETLVEPDGQRTEAWHSVRIYAMTELIHMLTVAGLNLQAYYGGLDRRDLTLDTRHIVVVACKPTA
jgi:SAM-dependent methyltransferase